MKMIIDFPSNEFIFRKIENKLNFGRCKIEYLVGLIMMCDCLTMYKEMQVLMIMKSNKSHIINY